MKILLLLLFIITGCMMPKQNLNQYDLIDVNNKTILVSLGNEGFQPFLKEILRENEFTLYIKSNEKDFAYAEKGKAKYELKTTGICNAYHIFTFEKMCHYNITFIDLEKGGTEVFYYSGFDTINNIKEDFEKIIKNNLEKQKTLIL